MQTLELDQLTGNETSNQPAGMDAPESHWREAGFFQMVGKLIVDNGGNEVSALND